MNHALITAPCLVAAVLIVSGVAKVRDPAEVDAAFTSMGVPSALSSSRVRHVFPWVEFLIGVALVILPGIGAVVAAVGALVLMVAYTVLVIRALRRPAASCHCFGSLTSGKITRLTVARNVTLVLLAALSIMDAQGGSSVFARLCNPEVAPWLVAIAVAAWLVFAVVGERAVGDEPGKAPKPQLDETEQTDALDYERIATPIAVLEEADGTLVRLSALTASRAVLLVWISFGCGSCKPVIDLLAAWRAELPELDVRAAVGDRAALASSPDAIPRDMLMIDPLNTLSQAVGTFGTPAAVLFGADGMLAGGPVHGPDDIIGLVHDIREQLDGARVDAQAAPGASE